MYVTTVEREYRRGIGRPQSSADPRLFENRPPYVAAENYTSIASHIYGANRSPFLYDSEVRSAIASGLPVSLVGLGTVEDTQREAVWDETRDDLLWHPPEGRCPCGRASVGAICLGVTSKSGLGKTYATLCGKCLSVGVRIFNYSADRTEILYFSNRLDRFAEECTPARDSAREMTPVYEWVLSRIAEIDRRLKTGEVDVSKITNTGELREMLVGAISDFREKKISYLEAKALTRMANAVTNSLAVEIRGHINMVLAGDAGKVPALGQMRLGPDR